MADVFTKKERSNIMRSVKAKENKSTELKLIKLFRTSEIKGWRRNYNIIGKPDFVFPHLKIVVFADGCFWHGHNCRNITPKDNLSYWSIKIKKNKTRDRKVSMLLRKTGWKVLRIWECQINKKKILTVKHFYEAALNFNKNSRIDLHAVR